MKNLHKNNKEFQNTHSCYPHPKNVCGHSVVWENKKERCLMCARNNDPFK